MTPRQADDIVAVYGWTARDLYELVQAHARTLEPMDTFKLNDGRVLLWIKQERKR